MLSELVVLEAMILKGSRSIENDAVNLLIFQK
jgi:hypothetical protein